MAEKPCSCNENSEKKPEYKEITLSAPSNKLNLDKNCCSEKTNTKPLTELRARPQLPNNNYIIHIILIVLIFIISQIYANSFVNWLIYDFFGQIPANAFPRVLAHFINNLIDIFLLLIIVVYAVAWLRAGLQVENIRNYLVGKKRLLGYVAAVLFGAITPFCSCSSIPIFVAFSASGIPLGITMAFLITSPMINEVAVFLLWGVVGWQLTLVYIAMGLSFGILGGYIMDAIGAERWIKLLPNSRDNGMGACACASSNTGIQGKISLGQRNYFAVQETINIVKMVWIWLIVGVGIGAVLYGYVPSEWFTKYMGTGQWWSVPAAVLAGIPLYANVIAIIPILDSLLQKGLPFGTTLAFTMSTVAISLPEIVMLRQVMRWQLLLIFIALMFTLFVLSGWLFNYMEIILS